MREAQTPQPTRPEPPRGVQPKEVPHEKRPDEEPEADLHEEGSELPGMPLWRDPLLNPGPTPD